MNAWLKKVNQKGFYMKNHYFKFTCTVLAEGASTI